MTQIITRKFLRSLNFRVMTDFDRQGFMGANSPVALIAENDKFLVVVDGNYCEIYDAEPTDDGTFEPTETCENICELPY
jgi:hypothetical protein